MEKVEFFAKEENLNALKHFEEYLVPDQGDNFKTERNQHIKYIVHNIYNNPDKWDKFCQVTIEREGYELLNEIKNFNQRGKDISWDGVFNDFLRLFVEYTLSDFSKSLDLRYPEPQYFAIANLTKFENKYQSQILQTLHTFPISIFKKITHEAPIKSLNDFNIFVEKVSLLQSDWDKKLAQQTREWNADLMAREKRVKELQQSLQEQENAFNFVGLYDGFHDLAEKKEKELKWLLCFLFGMGVAIISLPVCVHYLLGASDNFHGNKVPVWVQFIPSFSIGAVLIYFFRVILQNYKSVQSQLLQIDLRRTLCQFIQSYGDYSSELKSKDADALSKFENIIFSGIVSDSEKLPSTFDGLDPLLKLIKAGK